MNVVLWTQRPLNILQQLYFTYSLIVKWYIKLIILGMLGVKRNLADHYKANATFKKKINVKL